MITDRIALFMLRLYSIIIRSALRTFHMSRSLSTILKIRKLQFRGRLVYVSINRIPLYPRYHFIDQLLNILPIDTSAHLHCMILFALEIVISHRQTITQIH
jgi:hypothetical protein